jgi:hypothetical protein
MDENRGECASNLLAADYSGLALELPFFDEKVLVQLCQEGVKAPCCTEDEGGPFGAAR